MKRLLEYVIVISWMFLFVHIFDFTVYASSADELRNTWYETHFYPIYYDNEEWQKHGMDEFIEVNNPPYDLLLSMSSDELAALLIQSPYLTQITIYYGEDGNNEYKTFFHFIERYSDIFYELLKREDGITAILNQYRNSGIDRQWLENENNTNSLEGMYRWWAEILGSQFIHIYSGLFTEEETNLAKQIINEKNEIYLELPSINQIYFDVSDIDYHDGNSVTDVRTMFLTEEELSEREEKFSEEYVPDQKEDVSSEGLIEDVAEDILERDVFNLWIIAVMVGSSFFILTTVVFLKKRR